VGTEVFDFSCKCGVILTNYSLVDGFGENNVRAEQEFVAREV